MKKLPVLLMAALLWGSLPAAVLAAPSPPAIALTISGLVATATWAPVPGATGYTLYYAPAPYTGEETIGAIEVGSQTSFSAELWTGAAFYVAVKAYDSQGHSDYSNIEQFSILPPLRAAASATELETYLKAGIRQQSSHAVSYRFLALDGTLAEAFGALALSSNAGGGNYSGTNLQVDGVDEADRVKTDGLILYVAEQDAAHASSERGRRNVRVMAMSPTAANAAEIARVALDDALPLAGLYLVNDDASAAGDLLVALGTTRDYYYQWALDWFVPWSWQQRQTEVNLIDVANPAAPLIARSYQFDGQLVSSRRIGNRLYLVLRYNPALPEYVLYPQTDQELQRNRELIDRATLAELLPQYRVDGVNRGSIAPAERSYLPNVSPDSATADILTLVTLDLAVPDQAPFAITLAGPTETLYMSRQSLYLATTSSHYQPVTLAGAAVSYFSTMTTDIHKFALTATGPEYRGSGTVAGHLGWEQDKKSFRMGEVGDALGVVTSVGEDWGGTATSKLTILGESPVSAGALAELAHLPNELRPAAIGKPGERLYSARFLGNRLYLVTFRVTDPLYILDLANPADPYIAGELEIDGYSDYLHPVGEHLLLGIGKDAVPDLNAPPEGRGAWYQGLKLSLFDVSDVANPTELESIVIGQRGTHSEVLVDHHAIAYLQTGAGAARFAIPVELHETATSPYDVTAPWYYYDWTHTGLYLFDIAGINSTTPAIDLAGRLIVNSNATGEYGGYGAGDRAVLLNDSVHYLHGDAVWSSSWEHADQAVGPQ